MVTCALPKVADTIRLFCTAGLVLGFVTFIQVSINFLDLMILKIKNMADWWYSVKPFHCEKSLLILSFFGLYFPAFGMTTEIYSVNLRIKSKWENTDKKNSEYGHILPRDQKIIPEKIRKSDVLWYFEEVRKENNGLKWVNGLLLW